MKMLVYNQKYQRVLPGRLVQWIAHGTECNMNKKEDKFPWKRNVRVEIRTDTSQWYSTVNWVACRLRGKLWFSSQWISQRSGSLTWKFATVGLINQIIWVNLETIARLTQVSQYVPLISLSVDMTFSNIFERLEVN